MDEKSLLQTTYKKPLIGQSHVMQRVFKLIEKVADNDSTLLILGESGTGKEVVAKASHFLSARADKPFIPINCGAIPEALLESELFGHEKGSFTGANNVRQGRFELAHTGTIFLDEISEMPYPLQVKLLRVIQEREFERVGGSRSIKVDVRIIAATNVNLEEAVSAKRFRKDLYYRLNVIPIHLPPLRERREDIPLFIAHFIDQCNRKKQRAITGVSKEASDILEKYPWPGNIRELENIIERMVILADGDTITLDDLPSQYKVAAAEVSSISVRGGNSAMSLVDMEETSFSQLNGVSAEEKAAIFSDPAGVYLEWTGPLSESAVGMPTTMGTAPADGAHLMSSPAPFQRGGSEGASRPSWGPQWPLPLEISDEGIYFTEIVEAFENRLIEEALRKAHGVKSRAAQLLHLNRTTLVEKLKRRTKETVLPTLSSNGDGVAVPEAISISNQAAGEVRL